MRLCALPELKSTTPSTSGKWRVQRDQALRQLSGISPEAIKCPTNAAPMPVMVVTDTGQLTMYRISLIPIASAT